MPFNIIREDITRMNVDAIVNAANTALKMGGGVCGAIFKAAGIRELQAACDPLAPIQTGEAVITPGFALPARYIIHTAGPVYQKDQAETCEHLLRASYANALRLTADNHCESIAFPLISSGIYGYPKKEALRVASSEILTFLHENDMHIFLSVFDKEALSAEEERSGNIERYIDDHYVEELQTKQRKLRRSAPLLSGFAVRAPLKSAGEDAPTAGEQALCDRAEEKGLEDLIGNLNEPFSTALLRLIDAKGRTDADVYKGANIDRKLFSKIRSVKGYMPGKRTVLALAVSLELTLAETKDLLERAGYALSHSRKFDVIVEYFIVNKIYNIFEINEVLFRYDQPLLGN